MFESEKFLCAYSNWIIDEQELSKDFRDKIVYFI